MENEKSLVKQENPQSFIERLIEHAEDLEKVKEVGMVIINSGFCPQHFKESKDAVGAIMCIEAGRKLGLSWMQSLSDIYPVKGRIGIMGTAAKAVIFASGILESWTEITEGEYPLPGYKHITISKRKDLPNEFRTEFSVFDANTAGLMQKDIYKKYGKRMIAWRDIGFHASDYYQDILKGMKTVEELNDYDGLVPGTPEKITLKTEDGKEVTLTDKDKERSTKTTSRVASKIPDNKFDKGGNENIQEAEVIDEKNYSANISEAHNPAHAEKLAEIAEKESPFKAEKGTTEYMNGVLILRDEAKNIINQDEINAPGANGDVAPIDDVIVAGAWTLAQMEKMDTDELKKVVMEDMDMMEACEIIGGKNTNKKLRELIFAHQEGKLDLHVAPYLDKGQAGEVIPPADAKEGDIQINKNFDNEKPEDKQQQIDALLSKEPLKKEAGEAGAENKYGIDIPKETPRDFSQVKSLFNKVMGVTPQITTPRYMELSAKLGLEVAYPDKEIFLKNASVIEINKLLDAN